MAFGSDFGRSLGSARLCASASLREIILSQLRPKHQSDFGPSASAPLHLSFMRTTAKWE